MYCMLYVVINVSGVCVYVYNLWCSYVCNYVVVFVYVYILYYSGKEERLWPIGLLILPIILSRISHNFHTLFFIYSHAITYYYFILFLKFDCLTCKIAYGSCYIK